MVKFLILIMTFKEATKSWLSVHANCDTDVYRILEGWEPCLEKLGNLEKTYLQIQA